MTLVAFAGSAVGSGWSPWITIVLKTSGQWQGPSLLALQTGIPKEVVFIRRIKSIVPVDGYMGRLRV